MNIKLLRLLLPVLIINNYSFAEDTTPCHLNVIFNKEGESSFVVSKVKIFQNIDLNDENPYDPFSDEYSIQIIHSNYLKDVESWYPHLSSNSYGGFRFGQIYCYKAKKPECWSCHGGGKACNKIFNTKSFEMLQSWYIGQNSEIGKKLTMGDFLTSPIAKPYIQACENYIKELIQRKKELDEKEAQPKIQFKARLEEQTMRLRKSLKPSDITNCGTVIKTKGSKSSQMVYVQTGTDFGAVWFSINNIYPNTVNDKIISCRDSNRWYKHGGQWIQSDGKINLLAPEINYAYDLE